MMNKEKKLVPKLRFPEFEKDKEWRIEPLGNLGDLIVEKTKGRKYKLMSITSGVGLVSQLEKFGREIAGNSYTNYYVINKGDFAYNKSSTKLYPEGEIAMLESEESGAVPNSIFTCFRLDENKILSSFAKYPFVNNIHGNWLKKFITVGARANGALQVNNKDLFSIQFPYPSLLEQQKIASCLASIDFLIKTHSEKLSVLVKHKGGLMQNLFPQEGENIPQIRFPEFVNNGSWKQNQLINLGETINGLSGKSGADFGTGKPYVTYKQVFDNTLIDFSQCGKVSISVNENQNILQKGDILFTTSSETPHEVGFASVLLESPGESTYLNSFCFGFRPYDLKYLSVEFSRYLFHSPIYRKSVSALAQGSTRYNLSKGTFLNLILPIPSFEEQQKIAACLSSLDELIKAQSDKINQLKLHKKGLMQQLFLQTITGE